MSIASQFSVCEAKSEWLVRYPTTLAPPSGSTGIFVQCADNAHSTNSADMIAWCVSDGSWALTDYYTVNPPFPRCECDNGYRDSPGNGGKIC